MSCSNATLIYCNARPFRLSHMTVFEHFQVSIMTLSEKIRDHELFFIAMFARPSTVRTHLWESLLRYSPTSFLDYASGFYNFRAVFSGSNRYQASMALVFERKARSQVTTNLFLSRPWKLELRFVTVSTKSNGFKRSRLLVLVEKRRTRSSSKTEKPIPRLGLLS
jgi:hypothetical protein